MSSQLTERLRYFTVRRLVGALQILQRRVREDDTPTKGIAAAIAFENSDWPFRKSPLEQDAEIEAGRSAADARNAH